MWVFGYGSLLWYTDFPYEEAVPGQVQGYVRRFWQLSPDHRGTPDKPGRVVSLVKDEGGSCWGIAYKIPEHAVESSLAYLNFRERAGYKMERLKFYPDDGSPCFELSVFVPVSDTPNIYHTGPTDEEKIIQEILTCHGSSGSNLEYALRLADCQRRLAPHVDDEHLFGIEARLLAACEATRCRDEILIRLNYKLAYLLELELEASTVATTTTATRLALEDGEESPASSSSSDDANSSSDGGNVSPPSGITIVRGEKIAKSEDLEDLQRRICLHQRLIDEKLRRHHHHHYHHRNHQKHLRSRAVS